MAFAAVVTPLEVYAQNTNLGVTIIQLTPKEATGPVGTSVNLQGTIYSSNGSYQVLLGNTIVDSGIADGYYVNSNFTTPETFVGNYALTLRDVTINVNSTQQWAVTTGYALTAAPASLQEGSGVTLTAAVTGSQPGASYGATISVVLPSPLGTTYSKTIALGTPNVKGTASASVTFPDSSFQPSGSLTTYAGTYTAYFNQSSSQAQTTFTVNIIDSTTYHRGDTVVVRAAGYAASEVASLIITNVKTNSNLDTQSVTASADGVISANWVVPANTAIGDYTIKISSQPTSKAIPDSETFSVVGYNVQVQTTNLAGEVVTGITLQALDVSTGTVYNAVSNASGYAVFKLEKGVTTITAIWNGVNVGSTNMTVSGDQAFTIRCQLTNVKITVKNTNGVPIPLVNLVISYQYTGSNGSQTGSATGQTDASGSFTVTSILAGATYKIDASIYGKIFNAGNNTVSNLPTLATAEVVIICPTETLTLNVVGYNQEPIPNARIETVELSNGLFYSATADINGSATIQAPFGMYRARIYKGTALINETNVQVFANSEQQIRCTLYGIQLSVKVVDFFGSPISNVNVTLNGPTQTSAATQGDGTVVFNNIIGGNMQIIAQSSGTPDSYQALTVTVDQPATVQMKIDKYVAFGSMLIPASLFITILIILAALILLVIVEVFRRRRTKDMVTP